MNWTDDRESLEALACGIDPAIRFTTKNGWFWKAVATILCILSFGMFKRERFLESFATTVGPLQAYPESWSADQVRRALIHESRHTCQARVFGFGIHPWAGVPLMFFAYCLLPLPIGLAVFRAWLELDADRYRWRFLLRRGTPASHIRKRAIDFAETVSSAAYMWSLPASWTVKWFEKEAEKAIAEYAE